MTEPNEQIKSTPEVIPFYEISDPNLLSQEPLVSARMITYNHEPYIARAIKGVLMQKTNFPFELIIGEDFSTDRTRNIVFDYQKMHPEFIRVITSEKNVGMKENSSRTHTACRGKYIAFCEGDDYWTDPFKLQKQIDFLEANPDYGMVHSDGDYFDVKSKKLIKSVHKKRNIVMSDVDNIFSAIIESDYRIITCSVCLRNSILKDVIPEIEKMPKFKMGDTTKWLEFSKRGKIHFFDESMVQHNLLEESASESKNSINVLEFKKSGYELLKYFIKKYGVSSKTEKICHEKFNKVILHYAYLANSQKDANEAMNNLQMFCPLNITLVNKLKYLGTGDKLFRIMAEMAIVFEKILRKVRSI